MDAVKFLHEIDRICEQQKNCIGCPLEKLPCVVISHTVDGESKAEEMVNAVEKWSEERTAKTNGDVVREMMGDNLIRLFYEGGSTASIRFNADWWDAEYKEDINE